MSEFVHDCLPQVHSSDMEQSQGGESVGKPGEEEEEKVTPQSEVRSGEESRKVSSALPPLTQHTHTPSLFQVRFSSNLPATRQSRYGPDNEEEEEEERHKLTSPDSQQLLRGSASSHGFRSDHTSGHAHWGAILISDRTGDGRYIN